MPTTYTESTLHVRTPTVNINAPPFPPNLHQPPLLPHANRPHNFYTNSLHNHMPSHTYNTQLPPPFNPHVPPPYFPQYPVTTSPSAHSSDSSILLALQKQWECQEKLDMERNQMKKEKEERKRMKEEREQKKEDRKQMEKHKNQQRSRITKPSRRFPGLMAPIPVIASIGWNRPRPWYTSTTDRSTKRNCYLIVEPVCPRQFMPCHKELQTKSSRMQY